MPSPLSVTAERVPAVVERTGKQPLELMLPDASRSCIVIVVELDPLASMEEDDEVISVLAVVATEYFTELLGKLRHAPLFTSLRK